MQYQKNQTPTTFGSGQFGGNGQGRQGGNRTFGNGQNRPVAGEILNEDDKSITVKLPDGSTKIVILSNNTTFNKASQGSKSDLKTGEQVVVFGTANSDGSVTAQTISLGGGMMFRGMMRSPRPTQ